MAGATGEKKFVILKSSDGDEFEVKEDVAMESQTIRHMLEDDGTDNGMILLPNVNSMILSMVIEYCYKHVYANAIKLDDEAAAKSSYTSPTADEELKYWDSRFVMVDQATLFHLIMAAEYLDIKGLLDLTYEAVANIQN